MHLPNFLLPARRASSTRPAAARPFAAITAEDVRACGWFDSSHELRSGLCVQEDLGPEVLARELPLGAWLDLQLGAHGAARAA